MPSFTETGEKSHESRDTREHSETLRRTIFCQVLPAVREWLLRLLVIAAVMFLIGALTRVIYRWLEG